MISSLVPALISAFKVRRELALENVTLREQLAVLHHSVKRPLVLVPRNPLVCQSLSLISRDAVLSAMRAGLTTRCLTFRDTFVYTPTSSLMAFADTGSPADTSIQTRRSNISGLPPVPKLGPFEIDHQCHELTDTSYPQKEWK